MWGDYFSSLRKWINPERRAMLKKQRHSKREYVLLWVIVSRVMICWMLMKSERTAEPNAVNLLCSVKQGSDFKVRFSGFLVRRVSNARNPAQVTIPGGPDPGVRGPDLGPQKRQEMATFRQKVPFWDRNSPKSSVFDRLLTDLDTRIVNFWTSGSGNWRFWKCWSVLPGFPQRRRKLGKRVAERRIVGAMAPAGSVLSPPPCGM